MKTNQITISLKSPVIMAGLFYLCLLLLTGCFKETDPEYVTILFWTAISENDIERAKKYSTEGSEIFFKENKKQAHFSFQTGETSIYYDYATVKTYLRFQTAASSSEFKTFLIRDSKTSTWKVDYKRTINSIVDKKFHNAFEIIREKANEIKDESKKSLLPKIKKLFKQSWQAVKNIFKKVKKAIFDK